MKTTSNFKGHKCNLVYFLYSTKKIKTKILNYEDKNYQIKKKFSLPRRSFSLSFRKSSLPP